MLTETKLKKSLRLAFEALRGERWDQLNQVNETFYVRHGDVWIKYPGITRWMAKSFWPHYDGRVTARGTNRKRSREKKGGKSMTRREMDNYRRTHSEARGMSGGNQVHAELESWANLAIDEFQRRVPTLHSYTMTTMRALRDKGLIPIRGELPIFDEYLGFATRVDCVCVSRETGRIVLVEFKNTWNKEAFYKPSKNAKALGPLNDYLKDDSRASQAVAQILIAQVVLCVRYSISCDGKALLTYGSDSHKTKWLEGQRVHGSPHDMTTLYSRLIQYLQRKGVTTPFQRWIHEKRGAKRIKR